MSSEEKFGYMQKLADIKNQLNSIKTTFHSLKKVNKTINQHI